MRDMRPELERQISAIALHEGLDFGESDMNERALVVIRRLEGNITKLNAGNSHLQTIASEYMTAIKVMLSFIVTEDDAQLNFLRSVADDALTQIKDYFGNVPITTLERRVSLLEAKYPDELPF